MIPPWWIPAPKPKKDPHQRDLAAYHEIGHVLSWLRLGGKVREVEIDQRGGGGTWIDTKLLRGPTWGSRKAHLASIIAGPLAEARHGGGTVRHALELGKGIDGSDYDMAAYLMRGTLSPRKLRKATAEAEALLARYSQQQVELLAETLKKRGRLSGSAVRALVRRGQRLDDGGGEARAQGKTPAWKSFKRTDEVQAERNPPAWKSFKRTGGAR